MSMGLIYIIRCQVNNKIYIGKTTRTIEARWYEHLKCAEKNTQYPLYLAMNKYGIECFSISILEECNNKFLDEREIQAIKLHKSHISECGYNLTLGGDGTSGWKFKPGAKSGRNNSFYGRKHSLETKKKISNALIKRSDIIGRKNPRVIRNSDGKIANPLSKKEKGKRISDALKKLNKKWQPGTHPMLGKKHSDDSRQKMSESHKGKKHSKESRIKMSLSQKGIKKGKQSKEHREKLRNTRIGKARNTKKVKQSFLDGTFLIHDSVKNAALSVNKNNVTLIRECCNNVRKMAYGYYWSWHQH